MQVPEMLIVKVNRDGADLEDDLLDHAAEYQMPRETTIGALLGLLREDYLSPSGHAELTWVVSSSVGGARPLGVVALKWKNARTQVPLETTLEAYFGETPPAIFFDCWHQSDPEAVFSGLVEGKLP